MNVSGRLGWQLGTFILLAPTWLLHIAFAGASQDTQDPGRVLRRNLREASERQIREAEGPLRYVRVAGLSSFLPYRGAPWPNAWVTVEAMGEGGPEELWAVPPDGLTRIRLVGPTAVDPASETSEFIASSGLAVTYMRDPIRRRPHARKMIDLLAERFNIPAESVAKVRQRLEGLSELELFRASIQTSAAPWPGDGAPLEELFYRTVMAYVFFRPADGDHCYEFTRGSRTVLCCARENILESTVETDRIHFYVFQDSEPYYHIFVCVRCNSTSLSQTELRSRCAGVYRSILMYALKDPAAPHP